MLAFLNGKIVEKSLTSTIISVNGVGYECQIPMSTYDKLPAVDESTFIHVYLHIRQDAIQLFGFSTPDEKSLFLMLISYQIFDIFRYKEFLITVRKLYGFIH